MHPEAYSEKLRQRFLAKTEPNESGCWLWTASLNSHGYGQMWDPVAGKLQAAYRIAYRMFVAPIPEGMHIDHLCFVKACVNPEHLEPVTARENAVRYRLRQSHCVNGHPLNGDNLYVPPRGGRCCRRCQYLRNKAARERKATWA